MIEKIEEDGNVLAIVVRSDYQKEGLNFFTDETHSFQIGIHDVKKGKRYRAHKSKPFKKLENLRANKIYLIQRGLARVDVYNNKNLKIVEIFLYGGDLILFIMGGHGITLMENTKMIEIKQGPYRGVDEDKIFLE
ncbi:hypothetical protein J4477_03270 [Candidatus Pacearchaeota archaeon]|nr:hypothetical protein [Candidatus Pacearchaeota archaeon]